MAEVKHTLALTRRGLLSWCFKAAGPACLVNPVAPAAAQLNEPGAQAATCPADMQQLKQQQLRNIFDVASHIDSLPGSNAAAFKRIFRVTSAQANCIVGPELAAKYKVHQDNEQHVVSVTNMHSLEQTWYNQARTTKPQTFNSSSAAAIDPTNNGANCDFCAWHTLTAKDPGFGRIQLPHAVTGSNLFKYAEPSHGVVLFRHHDPLSFNQSSLSDLLDASWLWFQESHKLNPDAVHPFLLWNCLPRAGASQYHGHAQVMLSGVPVPGVEKLQRAASSYQQQHHGCCYYADLLRAHAAVGLARQVSITTGNPPDLCGSVDPVLSSSSSSSSGSQTNGNGGAQHSSGVQQPQQQAGQQQQQQHVAWGFASVAPVKDMEITVVGRHLCCPAFQRMLHAALRGLIEGLGVATFNVGVLNLDAAVPAPAGVGLGRTFWRSQDAASGADDSRRASGSSDDVSVQVTPCSSSGGHFVFGSSAGSSDGSSDGLWLPDESWWAGQPPVIARLASRGKLSSLASDFGGLEVWGGASIGHTDPFVVVQHLDAQLAAGAACDAGSKAAVAN